VYVLTLRVSQKVFPVDGGHTICTFAWAWIDKSFWWIMHVMGVDQSGSVNRSELRNGCPTFPLHPLTELGFSR